MNAEEKEKKCKKNGEPEGSNRLHAPTFRGKQGTVELFTWPLKAGPSLMYQAIRTDPGFVVHFPYLPLYSAAWGGCHPMFRPGERGRYASQLSNSCGRHLLSPLADHSQVRWHCPMVPSTVKTPWGGIRYNA